MELKKFAEELIEKTKDIVGDIEFCMSCGKSLKYDIKNKKISPSLSLGQCSIGIRVLKDGKIGFSAISRLDVEEAMIAVNKALDNTKPTVLRSFAEIKDPPDVKNFDPKIMEIFDSPLVLKDMALEMRDRLYKEAKNVESLEAGISISYSERLIATKRGISFSKTTSLNAMAEIDVVDFDFFVNYSRPDDWEDIKNLALNLYKHLPKTPVTPAELAANGKVIDVIFTPYCFEEILRTVLAEKVYGSSKEQNLTDLSVGDQIVDKDFTLIDTGIKQGLLSSSPTDDEGTLSQENTLIKDGVFKGFIYDIATALKAGKKPTGNGMRRPSTAEAPVRETLRGLYIPPGTKPLSEMIKEIKKGVYIKALLGLHGADRSRASFAAGVFSGKSIEDGKYTKFLKPGSWNISANLFDLDGKKGMLKDIELSKETFNTGSAILPWMKVRLKF